MNLDPVPTNLTSFQAALVAGTVDVADGLVLRGSALTLRSGTTEIEPNAGSVNAVLATYADPPAYWVDPNDPGAYPLVNDYLAGLGGVYRAVAPHLARWGLVQSTDMGTAAVYPVNLSAGTAGANVVLHSVNAGSMAWSTVGTADITGAAANTVLTGGTPPAWGQVGVQHIAGAAANTVLRGGTPVAWGAVQTADVAAGAISSGTLQTMSGSDYTSGSTSYQDITTTVPIKGTLVTTTTSDIYCICAATMGNNQSGALSYLAVRLDSGSDLGEIFMDSAGATDIRAMTTFRMFPATAPGTHVVTGRAKVSAGTVTVYQAYSRIMVWELKR